MRLRFVLVDDDGEHELAADLAADATVADLLAALGVDDPGTVSVDGRAVPTDHTVREAAIPDGAVLWPGPPPARPPAGAPGPAVPRLVVVAGVAAGDAVDLDRVVVVGRDPGCDLRLPSGTVSEQHCRVVPDGRGSVSITDLGSTNGTWVDGEAVRGTATVGVGAVVRCGAVVLRVAAPQPDDRPRAHDPLRHLDGRAVPFNRPPRPGGLPAPRDVEVPGDPPEERDPPPFGLLALLAPLVMGGAVVLITGDLRFALFALFSPVLLLGNLVTQRRRHGADQRAAAQRYRTRLATFSRDLAAAAQTERERRWAELTDVAEVRRRAAAPSTRLWERRHDHDDVLRLVGGVADPVWSPPLADARPGVASPVRPPEVAERLARHARLPRTPVPIDLSQGGVVGIVGARGPAAALARSLVVQACVLHGPADLPTAMVVDPDRLGDWDWAGWLPHVREPGGAQRRRLALGAQAGDELLASLRAAARAAADRSLGALAATRGDDPAGPPLLVVLDAPGVLRGRDAAARAVLRGEAGPVAGIVLAASEDQLPAVCDTVVTVTSGDGEARVERPVERTSVDGVLVAGLSVADARATARALAGIADPELVVPGGDLPTRVDLLDLLGPATPEAVSAAWQRGAGDDRCAVPIGRTADGVLELDLVRDGPHGLLGGTTGSGKSELLRSLVAGLAGRYSPQECTFVLVDYKGGAAFDVCADLPHVVGLVTDLDEHLGERALRSLEAELAHRERRLRACGVSDLPGWRRLDPAERGEPMPRLLVVIDEFATLRAELPDFVAALVGIAQRGRSLGVHLVLGTQRPSGAVDENVRANANLRIALRVTDRGDSSDVVGVPDAADIPPTLPGRGVVRVGPGAVVPVQTALVTGRSGGGGPRVRVGPLPFGPSTSLPAAEGGDGRGDDGPSDLDRLVDACREAFVASGAPEPRRPWLPPLPAHVPLADLAGRDDVPADGELPMALVDLPDEQAQAVTGWDLEAGTLLLHGVVGSGTTTTAAAAVLAAAASHPPDRLHVQVLDLGRGELAPLVDLPHVGAVVTGREDERRRRLLRLLLGEGARRRQLDGAQLAREPRLLVVVDGFEQLVAELDDPATYEQQEALLRFVAESPALRVSCLLTTTRVGGLRSSLTSSVEQRWALRLAAPDELAMLGLRPSDVPELSPGRAVRAADGRVLQVGHPGELATAVAEVAGRWPAPTVPPATVRTLPTSVAAAELVPALVTGEGAWRLPLGRADDDLSVAALPLHRGEHALLLGPPGSGRSGGLGALAAAAVGAGLDVAVVSGAAGSPLLGDGHRVVAPDDLGVLLREALADDVPLLVLVDDAERVPDPGAPLEGLAGDGARVHLVCAARPETVAADFSHWLRRVARARVGAVLRPTGDGQGDLLGARLPRRTPAPVTPGRGWLVAEGEARFVQLATVDG